MKKSALITTFALCALLTGNLFTGCSSAPSSETDQSKKSSSAADVVSQGEPAGYTGKSPISKEQTTISWLCTNGSALTYDWDKMTWCQEIAKRANVKIEMELIDSSVYNDTVMPRLAAGADLPDVVQIPTMDTNMAYINSGVFLDLAPYYDQYAFNLKWRFESNPTVKAQTTTPDGKIFYVPGINMSVDYPTALIMNVEWQDLAGFKTPTTTDEFYDALKAIKEYGDFNQNGQTDEWPLFLREGMLQRFGAFWGLDLGTGFFADSSGKVAASYTSDQYRDFLQFFQRVYSEGLLYNEFATANRDIQDSLFSKNVIGFTFHSQDNVVGYSKLINPAFDVTKDKMIMSPIDPLEGPAGDKFYIGNDPVFGFWGITKFAKEPEKVFSFLDYLYSEEANDLLYFGIEGTDYNVVNGQKEFTDTFLQNENNYRNISGNNMGGFPRILLGIHRDLTYPKEISDTCARLRPFYKLPIGFTFSSSDDLEVIQNYSADLSTYWSEMLLSFVTGTAPLTEWDSYVKTLESMNIESLRQVYQNKYDATN